MRLFAAAVLLCAQVAQATEYPYVQTTEGGRMQCGAAPPGWTQPGFDDRSWPAREPPPPDAGAPPADAGAACAATTFVRWRFDVGAALSRLATLTLRIRYLHGYAAYLNGVEIARRRLEPNADAAALATEYHGPEAERVFVPVRPGLLKATGNVLAVEVHPRTAGRAPLVEVALTGADGVRVVRGPYLQRLGEREVTVVFDTDLPALGEVRWGPRGTYAHAVAEASAQTHHELRLAGLKPGTTYQYRVAVRAQPQTVAIAGGLPLGGVVDAGEAVFHTPPEAGQPLRFIVYGDVRSGHDVHALLNRRMLEEDPDFALVTGDLVDRGSDEGDWERFFEVAAELLKQVAIFPAPGNHEAARRGQGMAAFLQAFRGPAREGEEATGYYSFDAGGVHFVALDSNQYRSPRQTAWLDQDLAAARKRGARALFVYAHVPPYSTGLHGDSKVMVESYVPILEKHKVEMFFGGHDHHYERGRVGALDYVVTGGGGAELRSRRCGVPGRKACPPHVQAYANEHHYVVVEVLPAFFRVCPRRLDGSAIEACATFPLRK